MQSRSILQRALLISVVLFVIAQLAWQVLVLAAQNSIAIADLSEEIPAYVIGLKIGLGVVIVILSVFMLRHVLFTLNRLFGHQRHPYLDVDVDVADWPTVAVLIPAHNEQAVIENALSALVDVDYPKDRLRIVPIDDRSEDATWEIIENYAKDYPHLVDPIRRLSGREGKGAAISEATELIDEDIVILFDADYVPGRALLKQLAAPFFDPEVGAVMGRVVPQNTG
jgi:cellulose synthase/poly-beta-1,6-N-acetylglucosamine synthase-like glycosyltransferase